ncbi:type IV secretory system conjugative DNA transfer family protein [Patescibacteria group bacterium]|nr:type IV secretory system conjugative DNA transfer family protein [Patescibacteria group bacterium]
MLADSYKFTIYSFDLNFDLGQVFLIFFLIGFLILALFIFRAYKRKTNHLSHQVYLVKLPKDKPQDNNKEDTVQELREDIAKGETIFASISGLKAHRGFKAWLKGREDHFAFEVVAHNGKIAFYVAVPPNHARYLEQRINAYYPDASIEEIFDYNAFNPKNEIIGGWLMTKKEFVFPIKTYTEMEVDPMNSIINVLTKLEKTESMAIQFVTRSAKSSWHRRVKNVVRKSYKNNSIRQGLKKDGLSASFSQFFKPKKTQNTPIDPEDQKRLTNNEEELLKKMEIKNGKGGLDVNLRIIVSAETKEKTRMYLENLGSSFSEYNAYESGNNLSGIKTKNQSKIIKDFIYRHFNEKQGFLLSTEELVSLYHLPLKNTETPNILWLTAKSAPAPSEIPTEGLLLGENYYRGVKKDVYIDRKDRRRHTYIVGKSGVGKSVLLTNMAVQDIENGEGVCVLDPHGDLIGDIIERIPPERAEDVIVFSPGDLERPIGLNLLEYDENYPEQKSFVINEMINILDKLYDLKATGGPMFEQYMRNALLLIMDDPESGSTLMEVPKVLADEDFRRMKLERCSNISVIDFWKKQAEKAGGEAALANVVPYITSKLTSFISNDMMRPIIGQQKSAFNIRDIMDNQKILLVDLPKGVVGEMNAYLLGMIMVGKILMASLSRANMDPEKRKDFYLYIDEFQNFTTDSITQILSEARKYNLNLIIAHQYIGQLSKNQDTSIKDAVFGNAGTMISFKVGSDDAEYLVKEYSPVFNEYDLINIGKGTAYLKLLVDNAAVKPFSIQTIFPVMGTVRPEITEKIRSLSKLKYGKNRRLIEAEINKSSSF